MFDQPFITEEHRMVADVYRKFVDKEIMPVRHLVDDDKDHKLIKKILQAMTDMGHQKAAFPEEYGGANMTSTLPASMMHEELGRGDSGIGTAATVTTWAFMPAIIAGNKAVLDRFAPDFCGTELRMGCFAMTEPGGSHGGGGCDIENPTMKGKKIRTIAKLEGDEWVINGQKMWGSNAGDADVYCVLCTTDPNLGDEGIALIYVPADAKGLSFGKFENKAGMEGDRNCAMYLDDVRVPKEWRAAGPGVDDKLLHGNVVGARINTAALAIGNARGAFETVLKFTEDRIVADRPVRQHSICAGMLADMAIGIETARAYYLNAAYMFDHPEIYGPPYENTMLSRASIAKVHAADGVLRIRP
jgi:butyryl-CoA dehydrogenase